MDDVYRSAIHNSLQLQTTQVSISSRMGDYIVVG